MGDRYDIVIVGAGHGGAQAAIMLRQHGFAGTLALVGDEPCLPYERPPLSKAYFSGEKQFEQILIRPAQYWAEREVAMLTGRRVAAVDPVARTLAMADGSSLGYGTLVWATGGVPRRLTCPGHDLAGVHTLRARADVDRITAELPGARRVAIVGGGYIGLETAAVLATAGKQVTVLEVQDRVLARVADEKLSRFFEAEHRAHGADIRLNAAVTALDGTGGRVSSVRLADGGTVPADMVLVGIGIAPAVEPLLAAGAAGGNGVEVDGICRTSLPGVYAVGDCALQTSPFADNTPVRIESVQNAHDQATVLARDITGSPLPHQAVPLFWSHQYDLRLQTVGLSGGNDQVVTRGDPASRAFSLVYLRRGRVIALDCVNAMKDYAAGRALVVAGARCPPEALADPAVPLRTLAPAA